MWCGAGLGAALEPSKERLGCPGTGMRQIWVQTPWFGVGEEPELPGSGCCSVEGTSHRGLCLFGAGLDVLPGDRGQLQGFPAAFSALMDGGKDGCPNSGVEVRPDRVKAVAELARTNPARDAAADEK